MPIELQTSRYLPIWLSLRKTGKCSITAPPHHHKRIIKAVKKRRDKDIAYRYALAEKNQSHRLKFVIEGTVIHFTLTTVSTLAGL